MHRRSTAAGPGGAGYPGAQAADVPAGNVYSYFKTKDDIIAAVIEAHVQQSKAALASIDSTHRSPKSRLKALVGELAGQGEVIAFYGCPNGSLCSELDKRPRPPRFRGRGPDARPYGVG